MSLHPETNPHFGAPQNQDQHSQFPRRGLTTPRYGDQQNQPPVTSTQRSQHQDQHTQAFPLNSQQRISGTSGSTGQRTKKPKSQDRRQQQQAMGPWAVLREGGGDQPNRASPQITQSQPESQRTGAQMTEQKDRDQHFPLQSPQERPRQQGLPPPKKTNPLTWFLAGFCAIFWVVIILGGLIVLIVYLVFRPHSPQFVVPSVTLNAAYLDVDTMLNADVNVLAKFSNPNKKVKVDFSYVVLDLYYGNTLIASQYIEPFAALRAESRLANVHMVTSQVRLPMGETQRLRREIGKNAVVFEVKGVFRARSNLGSFLRYSYWLYGHCTVVVTAPPSGVIKASKCKTKR